MANTKILGYRVIAVDFDGTIVSDEYPEIGKEIPSAVDVLKRLSNDVRFRLILWSSREGKYLDAAVEWCRNQGIEFYAVNRNHPEEQISDETYRRKIIASYYIDNHNWPGGTPDWQHIRRFFIAPEEYSRFESDKIRQKTIDIEDEKNIFIRFGRLMEKIKRKLNGC